MAKGSVSNKSGARTYVSGSTDKIVLRKATTTKPYKVYGSPVTPSKRTANEIAAAVASVLR